MPISILGSTNTTQPAGTSHTFDLPGGAQSHKVALFVVLQSGSDILNVPAGWALRQSGAGDFFTYLLTKAWDPGDPTTVVMTTTSSVRSASTAHAIAGADFEAVATAATGSGTSMTHSGIPDPLLRDSVFLSVASWGFGQSSPGVSLYSPEYPNQQEAATTTALAIAAAATDVRNDLPTDHSIVQTGSGSTWWASGLLLVEALPAKPPKSGITVSCPPASYTKISACEAELFWCIPDADENPKFIHSGGTEQTLGSKWGRRTISGLPSIELSWKIWGTVNTKVLTVNACPGAGRDFTFETVDATINSGPDYIPCTGLGISSVGFNATFQTELTGPDAAYVHSFDFDVDCNGDYANVDEYLGEWLRRDIVSGTWSNPFAHPSYPANGTAFSVEYTRVIRVWLTHDNTNGWRLDREFEASQLVTSSGPYVNSNGTCGAYFPSSALPRSPSAISSFSAFGWTYDDALRACVVTP